MPTKSHRLRLLQSLFGHTDAITCLTCSQQYGIVVSGSRDQTAIVWDLNRLTFVRQLGAPGADSIPLHPSPISAIAINDLTGDIATCASNELFVWTVNGELLARIDTLSSQQSSNTTSQTYTFPASATQILCVAFSLYNEWDPENLVMTGSSDGVVRMWTLEFVQVPEDEIHAPSSSECSIASTPSDEDSPDRDRLIAPPSKDEIVRRMSHAAIHSESNKGDENDSDDSEGDTRSAIDEWVNIETPMNVFQKRPSMVAELVSFQQNLLSPAINLLTKPVRSETTAEFIVVSPPVDDQKASKSSHGNKDGKDKKDKKVAIGERPAKLPKTPKSKKEKSMFESFIVVDNTKEKIEPRLKKGFQWRRVLTFKTKLTMHTAFDCQDNFEPAAITALAVSKDSRTLFVGDARGRVYSWAAADARAVGVAEVWMGKLMAGAEAAGGKGKAAVAESRRKFF